MLFVAKYAKYRLLVQGGSMRWVRDPSGAERQVDNGDSFWADFQLGGLDLHDRDLAVQEFTRLNPQGAFGAEPIMVDGSIDATEAAMDGNSSNVHEGYQVWQRLSRFDTEDGRMCPARWREAAEERLQSSEHGDFGRDYIRLDILTLVAPWPTYDEMDAAEVVPFAVAGGYDLEHVLRYEKAMQKRSEVGKPLKVALDAQRAARAEQAALTVNA